jgi:phosphohistidine swiveling domain-containing protein
MGEASVLSAGSAEGTIVRVDDLSPFDGLGEGWAVSVVGFDERMLELEGIRSVVERLREAKAKGPVVLVAPRPHVGLIALLDYADGCIFGFATMLSHLAIVLRERHIPAIADAAFVKTAMDGKRIAFDESGVRELSA